LVIEGTHFRIPCHIFPIAATSPSLEGLICQPSNKDREESKYVLDDKVSKGVALDFVKRCYVGHWKEVTTDVSTIETFEDFVEYGTMVDMHLSEEKKGEFKEELRQYIIKTVEEARAKLNVSKRVSSTEICHLFLVAHRFNLDLERNYRWMFFIHGLIEPGTHFDCITKTHLEFLATKRRKKDFRVGSSFFQFVFLMCFFKTWRWESVEIDWQKPTLDDQTRIVKFIERKATGRPSIRDRLIHMFGQAMFKIVFKASQPPATVENDAESENSDTIVLI